MYNRWWRGAAPQVHDEEGLAVAGTVFAGWPSKLEARAYCQAVRVPVYAELTD